MRHVKPKSLRRAPLAAAGLALGLGPGAAAPAALITTPVAVSGFAAPAGGTYSSFANIPVVNGVGQVAFRADLTGGSSTSGIFAGAPGSVQAAALQNTAAPTGGNYNSFAVPVINGTGQVAFYAGLTGGSSTEGIFAGVPGSVQAAALQNTAAPAGGTYSGFTNSPVLSTTGQVAFYAVLTGGSSTEGIFAGAPGSVQAAALRGTAAPGGSGGNYAGLTLPVLNGSGQVAFSAGLTGGSSTEGIFAGAPGSVQAAALQNTAAPAGGAYSGFANPVLNAAGQVAFRAFLTGGSATEGIFAGAPGSVQAAALRGTAAPAGGNYNGFGDVVLNGVGQVAFLASLTGGASTSGVFAGAPGAVQAVALVGTAAPGGSGGNFGGVDRPVLNGAGQVAFVANLSGAGITTANDTAIFAGPPSSLAQVVREGDLVDVDPGAGVVNRTVAGGGINFRTGSGGEDGRGMSFNDDGLLVYRLTFTDGSSGIFTTAVPEPASLGLLAAGIGALVRRRRRATASDQ